MQVQVRSKKELQKTAKACKQNINSKDVLKKNSERVKKTAIAKRKGKRKKS